MDTAYFDPLWLQWFVLVDSHHFGDCDRQVRLSRVKGLKRQE